MATAVVPVLAKPMIKYHSRVIATPISPIGPKYFSQAHCPTEEFGIWIGKGGVGFDCAEVVGADDGFVEVAADIGGAGGGGAAPLAQALVQAPALTLQPCMHWIQPAVSSVTLRD